MPQAPEAAGDPPPLIKKEHAKQQNTSSKGIKAAAYIDPRAAQLLKEAEELFVIAKYEDAFELIEEALDIGPSYARDYSELLISAAKILLSMTNRRKGPNKSKEGMQYARRAVEAKLKARRALLGGESGKNHA